MPHEKMKSFPRMICHEDALEAGSIVVLRKDSHEPSPSHSYFVSQNWEGEDGSGLNGKGKHPDNSKNTKLLWLLNMKQHLCIPEATKIWVWWDWCSVPQRNRSNQQLAVQSLCYYCQMCTRFLPLVRDGDAWQKVHGDTGESCNTLTAGQLDSCV